ncbi:concanavalin A-like lectin/glucanase domain-containing protein [Xylaria nigripes]|nr:concanavalin A-like lectin/glucanase domain-containing protein [Xylaria nigripes]
MAYSLSTHFAGQGLLDRFHFFTGQDPTHGFVDYQSKEQALASNLVSVDEFNRVRIGVDSINTYSTRDRGRPSVRITSNDAFTHGLFMADFAHMPGSTCGTWPSFWAFNNQENGTSWPAGGEVDIIEGANTAQRNLFSGHTVPGCQVSGSGFAGTQGPTDCSLTPDNIGCSFAADVSDPATYGDAFNAEGGGVYALEWDSNDIKIWHFSRSAIPENIKLAPMVRPEPNTWGPPQVVFGGSRCKVDSYFYDMSLAINTNFCGAYAGRIWGEADECNKLAPTCEEYVASNPSSFQNAFWEINYIDIYQKAGVMNSTSSRLPPKSALATQPPFPSTTSSVVIPSGTRTVTVTTITRVMSTAAPTRTSSGLADPAAIEEWTLLGCFGSGAGYESFTPKASSATMNAETCVASCAGSRYAGVSGQTCYCADTLSDATAVANELCDVPCPGNSREVCGGAGKDGLVGAPTNSSSHPLARAASSDTMLTVYGKLDDAVPPGAPGKGKSVSKNMSMNYATATRGSMPGTVTSAGTGTAVTVPTACASSSVPVLAPVPVTGAGTRAWERFAGRFCVVFLFWLWGWVCDYYVFTDL